MAEVALAQCSIYRPRHLRGVEVVVAGTGLRSFPAHVSRGLGVCVKYGVAREVTVEGRNERYPADAVSLRTPGCLWASEVAVHFVSVDVAPELLPGDWTGGPMGFVGRAALPDVALAARRMTVAADAFEAEEVLAELLDAVLTTEVISSATTRASAGPAGAVAVACEFLRDRAAQRPTLDAAAAAAGISKYALLRRFRKALGTTPPRLLGDGARKPGTDAPVGGSNSWRGGRGCWFLRPGTSRPVVSAHARRDAGGLPPPDARRNFLTDGRERQVTPCLQ